LPALCRRYAWDPAVRQQGFGPEFNRSVSVRLSIHAVVVGIGGVLFNYSPWRRRGSHQATWRELRSQGRLCPLPGRPTTLEATMRVCSARLEARLVPNSATERTYDRTELTR
jgi:hypothetical protein